MSASSVNISWGMLWRIFAMAALVYGLYLASETVAILLLALIISTIFDPAVNRLERLRVPRILGTIIVFFITLTILAFVLYTIIPLAILQIDGLFANLEGLADQLIGVDLAPGTMDFIGADLRSLTNLLLAGSVPFLQVLGKLLGGVAFVIATLVLSFYLTASRDGVEKFLRALLPEQVEARALKIYRQTKKKIGRWFQAQLFLSFVVGGLVFVGLSFLGVEQALILAVIAAVFELVPIVGPIFAGAIAVAVALGESTRLALYVLILFVFIQQLENQVLVPLVVKKIVGIHPIMILVSLLAGIQIAGIIGALIAIPAAVFMQELLDARVAAKGRRSRTKLTL